MTRYLTTPQVSEILAVHPDTLRRWRREGCGPVWERLGNRLVRYSVFAVDQWMLKNHQRHNPMDVDWIEFHPAQQWRQLPPEPDGVQTWLALHENCYVLMAVREALPGQVVEFRPGNIVAVRGDRVDLPRGKYE